MFGTTARKKFAAASFVVTLGMTCMGLPQIALADFGGSGRGIPGRREGAGTRGTCLINSDTTGNRSASATPLVQSAPSLVALVPESNLGLTLAEYPTLFWYVPESVATTAQFTLYNSFGRDRKVVYETQLKLDGKAGIISLQVPNDGTVAPLALDRTYYWTFKLLCINPSDPNDRSGDIRVEGFVQRVMPPADLVAQLKAVETGTTDSRQLPAIYAQAGIWHETLASLAKLRQDNPDDVKLKESWASLMQDINLAELANVPLRPCCQPTTTTTSRYQ